MSSHLISVKQTVVSEWMVITSTKSPSVRKKHFDSVQLGMLRVPGKVIKASSSSQGSNSDGIFTDLFGTWAEDCIIRCRRETRSTLFTLINKKMCDNNTANDLGPVSQL